MKTVFILDHNHEYRELFRAAVEGDEVEVVESDCPDSAYKILATMDPPDLIVCDLYMPFMTGAEAADYKTSYEVGLRTMHELAWVFPDTPVIALTGLPESDLARVRQYIAPIPAYPKTEDLFQAAAIVRGFLDSQTLGGVQ
jgi:CheY-like chemotaxis protein